VAWHRGLSEFY